MKNLGLMMVLLGLAACGVDGEPTPPVAKTVTISGTVAVGVSG